MLRMTQTRWTEGLCGSVVKRCAKLASAVIPPPDLRPAEEEALIAGRPVDHRRILAAQRRLVGVISDRQAGKVGDILAQREFAVDLLPGQRLIGVILMPPASRSAP